MSAWDCIQRVDKLPFRLASKIGEGANCAVYSIGPAGQDVWYSEDSESETYSSCGSSCSCSGSHSSRSYSRSRSRAQSRSRDKKARSAPCSRSPASPRKKQTRRPQTEGGARAASESESESEKEKPFGDEDEWEDEGPSEELSQGEYEELIETLRVHKDTPTGRVQVVAKRFSQLDEELCYAVVDARTNETVKIFGDEEDCGDYMRRRQLSKEHYYVRQVVSSENDTSIKCTGFQTEAIITLAVSELAARNITPHVCLATDALQERNTGYLLLERIDGTLDDVLNDEDFEEFCLGSKSEATRMSAAQVAGLIFQSLFATAVLQRTLRMKHHDLHSSNVFIKKLTPATSFRGHLLQGATHFHYHLDGTDYYVPSCNAIVKIGDFGMSSIDVRGKRVERLDMDVFNDNVEKWGYWSSNFDGERGYDTQLLFSDIPVDGHWRKSRELHRLLKALKLSALGKKGKVTRRKGRPLPGHVSNQPADALLQNVFLRNAEPWYNFRVQPEGEHVRIVTLGDSRYFS